MRIFLTAFALICSASAAHAQGTENGAAVAEQKEAIAKLSFLHGEWRGNATINNPAGTIQIIQTERAGPMLDGTILAIEGAGFTADGSKAFNAFAIISYDSVADRYWLTSWSNGRSGKFPLTARSDGFDWEMPGPGGATIKYKADVGEGKWREVGSFHRPDGQSLPFMTMEVKHLAATQWPASGAVAPKP